MFRNKVKLAYTILILRGSYITMVVASEKHNIISNAFKCSKSFVLIAFLYCLACKVLHVMLILYRHSIVQS